MANTISFGYADKQTISLDLTIANRLGLISGATGTGKTVSLQTLVQGFSRQGVRDVTSIRHVYLPKTKN